MIQKNIIFLLLLVIEYAPAQTALHAVTGFGSNPGNLNMYTYVPAGINAKAPLVLAMHGCGEDASLYAAQTGWNKLADEMGFYVVYPEQNLANNSGNCFNWFVANDETRGQGEPLSIVQMVQYMQAHYDIDTTRIFITGLSAGGCMTSVMLACYPDVFNAGAIMAGVPYKAATNILQSDSVLFGEMIKTPAQWGALVYGAYPNYSGSYPRVAVFQGTADAVSNQQNAIEDMKQWTYVNGATQTPAIVNNPFNGNNIVTQSIYNDSAGTPVVETFFVTGMPHGIALDTGSCFQQCGEAAEFALEVHLSSSFWAAYFFGITGNDSISIQGLQAVIVNQAGVTYSVPNISGTDYTWTVPQGAVITSGQGTNQVTVTFGAYSGNVSVEESSAGNCSAGPANMFVTAAMPNSLNVINTKAGLTVFPNPSDGTFRLETGGNESYTLQLYDILGKLVLSREMSGASIIEASGLINGVYFARVYGNGSEMSGRVVIMR